METKDYRISKLRAYLFNEIENITNDISYQINADFLGKIDDYSLDKIPTESKIEEYITGGGLYQDTYSFRSRKEYSQDTIINLANIGFFEEFEKKIKSNNDKGILPDINGILGIKCLNCGTYSIGDENSSIFEIQIQITYEEEEEDARVSN